MSNISSSPAQKKRLLDVWSGFDYNRSLQTSRSQDDVLEPVRRFMAGHLKEIYDESRRFLEKQNANFSDLQGDEGEQIRDILADPACFKGNSCNP